METNIYINVMCTGSRQSLLVTQEVPFLTCSVFISCPAAPGGTLSDDMTRTEFCLFTAQEDLETMQAYAQVEHEPSDCVYEISAAVYPFSNI